MCFFLLSQSFLDVFVSRSTTCFIDVLTWHEQQKTPKTLLYQCCFPSLKREHQESTSILIPAVIAREGSSKLGVLLGLPRPFSWFASCNWWRVTFLVFPFPPCGLPLLGCLLARTSVLGPCFLFSPFLSIKLCRVCFFCWSSWDLPTSCHTLSTIGKPFMSMGAPRWFHNISTYNGKVIEYSSKGQLQHMFIEQLLY